MNQELIALMTFYVFYIVAIGVYMFRTRFKAVAEKKIRGRYFTDYQGEIPYDVKVVGNHYNNQFQVPILFFIVSTLAIQQNQVSQVYFFLAIGFVLSRFVHSYIHLGKNHPLYRAMAYFTGFLCVLGMWLILLV